MPAPLDVDREALETLVKAVGVREAARQTGIAVPTLGAMSSRYGWLKQAKADAAPKPELLPVSMRPVHTVHTKPSKAMGNIVEKHGGAARVDAAKAVAKGMKHLASLDGGAILAQASDAASLGKLAVTARLPEWAETGGAAALLGIAVTVSSPSQVVDVEATVLDSTGQGQSQ